MEKAIVKDIFFLQQPSEQASREDLYLAQDLQDTLQANQENCIGLAANMIGVRKRVIIFLYGLVPVVMFNPVLRSKSDPYQTEEGCLSLTGSRPTQRYQEITVDYLDKNWQQQTMTLKGLPAQICQHELDHLEGIII